MKIEYLIVVAFIVIGAVFIKTKYSADTLRTMDNRTEEYNRGIDTATDDAMKSLLEVADSFENEINLEACQEAFFNSLYANFGLSDNLLGQETLRVYVPVMLVTASDGFYIMYHSRSHSGGSSKIEWTAKMPYVYSGTVDASSIGGSPNAKFEYVWNFTMDENVDLQLVYSPNDGVAANEEYRYKGCISELTTLYPATDWSGMRLAQFLNLTDFFEDKNNNGITDSVNVVNEFNSEMFNRVRMSAMAYQVTRKMSYYIGQHNNIAKDYGISYEFTLPESSTDSFARAITDVSVMSIFQGYPYGKGTTDVYSKFAVSGARIYKGSRYYVDQTGSIKYYHKEGCDQWKHSADGKNIRTYDSKTDCTEHGYYPCPKCNP